MTAIRNQVQLIGNLGKKPELKNIGNGKQLVTFSLATSDYYLDNKGERKQQTQWHNVIAWGKTAQIVDKYLDKGSEIALNGKLVYRQYEDKEGNKRYITEVVATEILMLGGKKS
jgi:single-strand DNA-binding protein